MLQEYGFPIRNFFPTCISEANRLYLCYFSLSYLCWGVHEGMAECIHACLSPLASGLSILWRLSSVFLPRSLENSAYLKKCYGLFREIDIDLF